MQFFKKDNMAFGTSLGAVIPILMFILLSAFNQIERGGVSKPLFDNNTLYVLSIFTNIVPFRIYMVNLKMDKTGRGILLVTFIYAGFFVYQAKQSGTLF
ncbi:MAG: hypothetical protein ACK4GL_01400 [Flavobacteriales bacterium]